MDVVVDRIASRDGAILGRGRLSHVEHGRGRGAAGYGPRQRCRLRCAVGAAPQSTPAPTITSTLPRATRRAIYRAWRLASYVASLLTTRAGGSGSGSAVDA